MSHEKEYEEALIVIWQKLGRFAPIDTPNPVHNERIEKAYYAAENALYKAGRIKLDEKSNLVLVPNTCQERISSEVRKTI